MQLKKQNLCQLRLKRTINKKQQNAKKIKRTFSITIGLIHPLKVSFESNLPAEKHFFENILLYFRGKLDGSKVRENTLKNTYLEIEAHPSP